MNIRNYDREMEEILKRHRERGERSTLLLHACCAPCASACLMRVMKDLAVTVFYYNPNITDKKEYEKRVAECRRLIGLLNAVNTYRDDKGASFKTYCFTCVQNKMLTELERRSNSKQQSMQNYLPLEELEHSGMSGENDDPFRIVVAQEDHDLLMAKARTLLSGLEQETLSLYLSGHSYTEIATRLNLTTKAVDNALQRVRRKLRES